MEKHPALRAGWGRVGATRGVNAPRCRSLIFMRIVILGSAGFIGGAAARALRGTRHRVYALSRADADLRDAKAVRAAFLKARPDAILNFADHKGGVAYVGAHQAEVMRDNLALALALYRAASEAAPRARIINPLSHCSYPGDRGALREEEWLDGAVHESIFAHGNAKRALYYIASSYAKQYGIRSVNFLLPGVFGPGDQKNPLRTHALNGMIIRMIQAKRNNEKAFEIWGTGKPVRDWVYIDDIVRLLLKGLTTKHDLLYPLNLAGGTGYSIKRTAEIIAEELPYRGRLVFNTAYPDGAPKKVLDTRRFRKVFPRYSFTDFRSGIREAISYYESVL